jgi:hypothetical protein
MRTVRIGLAALGVAVIATAASACGSSTSSASSATSTSTGAAAGHQTIPAHMSRTSSSRGASASVGTVTSASMAIVAVNTSDAARAAVRAAAVGRSGCAVHAQSGGAEVDLWDPAGQRYGEVLYIAGPGGRPEVQRATRVATWRPPGGPNCTVAASGELIAF